MVRDFHFIEHTNIENEKYSLLLSYFHLFNGCTYIGLRSVVNIEHIRYKYIRIRNLHNEIDELLEIIWFGDYISFKRLIPTSSNRSRDIDRFNKLLLYIERTTIAKDIERYKLV